VPDPQDRATYDASILRWDERDDDEHAAALAWHRSLIELRRTTPDLRDDDLSSVTATADDGTGTLVIERGAASIACNLGSATTTLEVRPGAIFLASDPAVALDGRSLTLPPDSVVVLHT
jgi:maltooligosyltrehalose trehalohydrolase